MVDRVEGGTEYFKKAVRTPKGALPFGCKIEFAPCSRSPIKNSPYPCNNPARVFSNANLVHETHNLSRKSRRGNFCVFRLVQCADFSMVFMTTKKPPRMQPGQSSRFSYRNLVSRDSGTTRALTAGTKLCKLSNPTSLVESEGQGMYLLISWRQTKLAYWYTTQRPAECANIVVRDAIFGRCIRAL